MNPAARSFDPVWEQEIYGKGLHFNRYPYDTVVSFIYRHYPRSKPRDQVRILEIGCGSGNNLWFAAREGFSVTGIDGSAKAIDYVRQRFSEEGLAGDFHVGDFTQLPFADETFDLAIDRGALTCCGYSAARQAVAEVHRTLLGGGRFFLNPYSDRHSSALSGRPGPDGVTLEISAGSLINVGQICFYGRRDVESLLHEKWSVQSIQHLELLEQNRPEFLMHAEWRVIAEKIANASS